MRSNSQLCSRLLCYKFFYSSLISADLPHDPRRGRAGRVKTAVSRNFSRPKVSPYVFEENPV